MAEIENWLDEHDRRRITKSLIRRALKKGFVLTEATAMVNGGSHKWWMEGGEVLCYGSGPGWEDQNASCTYNLTQTVDFLFQIRRRILFISFEKECYY